MSQYIADQHLVSCSFQNLRPEIPSMDAEEPPAPGWENLMVRCWDEEAANRPSFEEV